MSHFIHRNQIGEFPATLAAGDCMPLQARKELTQVVKRIAPPLMASGRLERAKVAWKKYIGGALSRRAAILVSRDYAAEFAGFRHQGIRF